MFDVTIWCNSLMYLFNVKFDVTGCKGSFLQRERTENQGVVCWYRHGDRPSGGEIDHILTKRKVPNTPVSVPQASHVNKLMW